MLAEQAGRTGRRGCTVTPAGLDALRRYEWPGNLRELANVLERATILASGPALGPDVLDVGPGQLPAPAATGPDAPVELVTLEALERRHIEAVLSHTGGRVYGEGGAAAILGLKPSTLQSRMKKLGVRRT
jgi:DNA-binding NtrC family response regulator